MIILQTERLVLREMLPQDAEFILELLNQPSYRRFIGDKGVRDLLGAENFIENVIRKSYRDNGYGHYLVRLKDHETPLGVCGFMNREMLDHPDIGFAFLTRNEGNGYAREAASGVLKYGREQLNIRRVVAITTRDNERSGRLLEKIGLKFDRLFDTPEGESLKLFTVNFES